MAGWYRFSFGRRWWGRVDHIDPGGLVEPVELPDVLADDWPVRYDWGQYCKRAKNTAAALLWHVTDDETVVACEAEGLLRSFVAHLPRARLMLPEHEVYEAVAPHLTRFITFLFNGQEEGVTHA